MKKISKSLVLIVLSIVLLTSCAVSQTSAKYNTEQKVEDFMFMYNFLEKEYPLFTIKQRMYGVDWLSNRESYINRIKETSNDKEFYQELSSIISEIKDGHTNIVSPRFYNYIKDLLKDPKVKNEFVDEFLTKPINESIKEYNYWSKLFSSTSKNITSKDKEKLTQKSLEFKKYHDGDTIYIKFKSFSVSDEGCQQVYQYIVDNKDCSNIIIDIRDNPGGSDLQWLHNIVLPLNNKLYVKDKYVALRGGQTAEKYANILLGDYKEGKIAMANRPDLPNYPPELASDFQFLIKTEMKFVPEKPVGFSGKIYVLTNKKVYSAGEGFATFCKRTGFAILVGERTGGDGGSTSPILVRLPNSGLLLRMRLQMTLNPDGSANAEMGTEPDIKVKAEDALTEVLKVIEGRTE